jgi:DNA-binding transcriptional ArsR family regulator
MRHFMQITRALSDENRVRILLFLTHSELCLCQIIELLKLSPSTVSKHMSILIQTGLVDVRKEGRWHYYRLPEEPEPAVSAALDFLQKSAPKSTELEKNRRLLKEVLRVDKEELCRHYKN